MEPQKRFRLSLKGDQATARVGTSRPRRGTKSSNVPVVTSETTMRCELTLRERPPASVSTTPVGARVSYRRYGDASDTWTDLGVTPIVDALVPAWTNLPTIPLM